MLVFAASMALLASACGTGEPTPGMERAASFVLGSRLADGSQSLGECLGAAGYEVRPDLVARDVEQKEDIELGGRRTSMYGVIVKGPDRLSFLVAMEAGFVMPGQEGVKQRLSLLSCELP